MNKRHLLFLSALLIVSGCSDDGNGSKEPITPESKCDSCHADQVCVDGQCVNREPEVKCDPACAEDETCVNGKCGICIGNECFFGGDDPVLECESNQDCGDGKYCHDGACEEITAEMCVPSCPTGQTCVKGECVNATLLWSLCQSTSDCGTGDCIFFATPSKSMTLKVGEESIPYDANNPIPVSVLDSRINAENYNLTHQTQAVDGAAIGICSYDCTKQENEVCPTGWSCQVVAKGELSYPGLDAIPVALNEADLVDTPFAAICRRDIDEILAKELPYGKEFCNADESACKAAKMVFYDNMCLDTCDDRECPFFFSCKQVDVDGNPQNLCIPDSGTCSSCYDHDGDGAGYGHCKLSGIDCNDDNSKIYYTKELECNDIYDGSTALKTDMNCNGIIDIFEMFGTTSSCNACGVACNKPNSENITVECIDTSNTLANNWRENAQLEMQLPEFACIETCSFGYGDCKGDTKCSTRLLNASLIESAKTSDNIQLHASDVISGDSTAKIYALDADNDGYPAIDIASTQAPDDPAQRGIVLDAENSVVCCSQNTNYCYTANADWRSVKLSEAPKNQGEKYISPENPNSPTSYDIDDTSKKVNPKAIEQCDGIDNDGSTILSGALAEPCSSWCAQKAPANATEEEIAYFDNIESICDKISDTKGGKTVYETNAYCDATQDGLNDTTGWKDRGNAEANVQFFGDKCTIRQTNDNVCSESGSLSCEPAPHNSCIAGSNDCKCATDGHAFRITETNHKVDPLTGKVTYNAEETDYVKNVIVTSSGINTEKCLCNGTHCETATDECDSEGCYEACNRICTTSLNYALTCTAKAESSTLDGVNEKGELKLDGVDDDCDGKVDEDAIQPCIITVNFEADKLAEGITDTDHFSITGYDIKKAANKDGSINICRIGVLKSRLENNKYIPVCYPVFKPRDNDFYGDGYDSNCDGVDYDIKNTVFVSLAAQGNTNASDANTCKFDSNERYAAVSPCATLNRAMEAAKDDAASRYHDILIMKEEEGVTFSTSDKTSLIDVPTLGSHSPVKQGYIYSGTGLPNEAEHVQDGHIISAEKLHRLLVNKLKANANFNPNLYRFSYDKCDYNATTKKYTCTEGGTLGEQNQPAEVIRIYGGFVRTTIDEYDLKAEHDLWQRKTTDSSSYAKIIWNVLIDKNTKSGSLYSMVLPSGTNKLSLLLDRIHLEMKSKATSDVSSSATESLPSQFADGVTFIGINASKSGASILSLNYSNLTIKAPAGFSYSTMHNDNLNGIRGNADGTRADRNENDNSGWDDNYINAYKANTCKSTNKTCGRNLNDRVTMSYGGCGGYSKTSGQPTNYINGKQPYQSFTGMSLPTQGKSSGLGGGSDWYCPKVEDTHRGGNGNGGSSGIAGRKANTKMEFKKNSDGYLYVSSDRSNAKGSYGDPGVGGAGGAVFQCWKGNGSDHAWCYGASGGDGGCGGEGGRAGGTGGSALGIVIRSDGSNTALNVYPESPSTVAVTPGNGGMPEQGGKGGDGTRGGFWYGYSRCSGTARYCSDTQNYGGGSSGAGGGGGAGGNGAGGIAGWTYPYVLYCSDSSVSLSLADLKYKKSCGFDISTKITDDPTKYGTQNHGQAYEDSSNGENGTIGKRSIKSLRWSRDSNSSESGERGKCGGSYDWDYVVAPGGTGGAPTSVATTQKEDLSCTYKVDSQDVNVIIKTINSGLN